MKYQTYIEEILFDNPSSRDKEEFNTRLNNNPVLKEEYETYLDAVEFLRASELTVIEESEIVRDFEYDPHCDLIIHNYKSSRRDHPFDEGIKALIHNKTKKKGVKIKILTSTTAFIVFTFLGVLLYLNSKPLTVNLCDVIVPQYIPSVSRSSQPVNTIDNMVANLYFMREVDSAITVIASGNTVLNDPLLLPLCLIESGKPDEAMALLSDIDSDSFHYYSSLWYRSNCLLLMNDRDSAASLLTILSKNNNNYSEGAKKLLKALKMKREIRFVFKPRIERIPVNSSKNSY